MLCLLSDVIIGYFSVAVGIAFGGTVVVPIVSLYILHFACIILNSELRLC